MLFTNNNNNTVTIKIKIDAMSLVAQLISQRSMLIAIRCFAGYGCGVLHVTANEQKI